MKSANKAPIAHKAEILQRISEKTGFTIANCRTAYNAIIEVFQDILMTNRSIIFPCFGRLEPFVRQEHTKYKLDPHKGLLMDENGEPVIIVVPAKRYVKFVMSVGFRDKMNAGLETTTQKKT